MPGIILLRFRGFRQVGRFGIASVVLTLGVGAGEFLIAHGKSLHYFCSGG